MKQNLLPAAVLVMSLLFGSCTKEGKGKDASQTNRETADRGQQRSLPEVITLGIHTNGKTEIEYTQNGQLFKVEAQDSEITGLFSDGREISRENYARYRATGETILHEIEASQSAQSALTPPKAKGPGEANQRTEVIDLSTSGRSTSSETENADRVRLEAERKLANKAGSQQ